MTQSTSPLDMIADAWELKCSISADMQDAPFCPTNCYSLTII